MKNSYLSVLGLFSFTMLFAEFSVEFTAEESYLDGSLAQSPKWQVFDASGKDAACFTVDAEEPGTLLIDPTESGFQVAAYTGEGGNLTSNTYYIVSTFRLIYPEGNSSLVKEQPVVLPVYEIQNTKLTAESVSFGLRQVSTTASKANLFNVFTLNKFEGSNDASFSTLIKGEDIGLAVDDSGNWTDGNSDMLAFLYSIIYKGENVWVEKVLLFNAERSAQVVTFSRTIKDSDNSFAENAGRFRIYGLFMDTIEVAVALDSITLKDRKD